MYVRRNIEACSCTHRCIGKEISITQPVSVYIASRQCAYDILSAVTCPAQQYFPTLSHNRHDFRKNITET